MTNATHSVVPFYGSTTRVELSHRGQRIIAVRFARPDGTSLGVELYTRGPDGLEDPLGYADRACELHAMARHAIALTIARAERPDRTERFAALELA